MSNEIRKVIHTKKHPYYSGKTSSKTEYEFYMNGKRVHNSRNGRPFGHVARYKKYVAEKFDVDVNDINISDHVQRHIL